MTTNRDPRFPAVIPTDVTVSGIDLDTEPFHVSGERLTEARAERIADGLASRVATGRPSLTAPGEHSPVLNLRISAGMKHRLVEVARDKGLRQSDVVRQALTDYLTAV